MRLERTKKNPFKLSANEELKPIDPKHFLEVKNFYYTNLFEEVVNFVENFISIQFYP